LPAAARALAIGELWTQALAHHRAGRLVEAARLCRRIIDIDPSHVDSLHHLGIIAHQAGQDDLAVELIGRVIALDDSLAEPHFNIGTVLHRLGRLDEAVTHYRRAVALAPGHAEARMNLGIALKQQGKLDAAIAVYRRTLEVRPGYAEAHANLGGALAAQGRLDEAADSYQQALALRPDIAEIHQSLGHLRLQTKALKQAEMHYRRAIALKPDDATGHMSLGVVARRRGRLDEAVLCHRRALELKPDHAEALHNLAAVHLAQGDMPRALEVVRRGLSLRETPDLQRMFVHSVRLIDPETLAADLDALRGLVVRAISEPWDRPSRVATVAARLIRLEPRIAAPISRAAAAWPARLPLRDLLGPGEREAVFADPLLRALMESTQVCDIEIERLLTGLRSSLLDIALQRGPFDAVENDVLGFCCALARQSWINEHVFDLADGELERAAALRSSLIAALDSGAPIEPLRLAVVASYFPLDGLDACAKLLERSWPDDVTRLLAEQVLAPMEERHHAQAMPRLTTIDDAVSRLVRQQYEQNPYPRWVKMEPAKPAPAPDAWLRETFPSAASSSFAGRGSIDILVAGCGTGQHSIEAARRILGARVLAVDLSLASLGYAVRKSRELGLDNIDHAHADILELGSIGRSFDIIESSGVLHHLADWRAGWRVLLTLLRPGGLMRLGFYSERARQDVAVARAFIAARGYVPTADDIRRCRQDLIAVDAVSCPRVARFSDFFTMSECRDLLFHAQEHRLTLPPIREFLIAHDLTFLGFEIDPAVVARYRARFPDDETATDLACWDILETEDPGTFGSMYVFWVQHRGG
jgi:tetratricopeptide (TPR) repeat protein/SAM-dependent methyltransferase